MNLKKFDDKYRERYQTSILGIDEAGRGSIAGPLVVAGVILKESFNHPDINDSKKLTELKRKKLYDIILENAINIYIEKVSPSQIDKSNILKETTMANERIAKKDFYSFVITDFITLSEKIKYDKLVKADEKSLTVTAASIVAKVTRDEIMKKYHKKYPKYGFATHKGYGTQNHINAIEEYGVLDIHRKSFKPIRKNN